MSNLIKNNRGITLIALVITIVVLIILAGVSINLVLGNNGLIEKAKQAKEDTINAQIYDEEQLNSIVDTLKVPSNWTNVKEIKENVPIPNNFYYVGGTIETGVIISDNVADENKGESYEISKTLVGNQFVWIPVPLEEGETFESKYPRTEFGNNMPTTKIDTNITEPYASGYDTEAEEYNTMLTSVNKYKGFYVGRYEVGCATERTVYNRGVNQSIVIRQGAYVYNYVPWGASMSSTAPYNGIKGAIELSKSLKYVTVNSTLIYGIQWDMMMRYVADETHNVNNSASWGNYNDATGDATTNCGSSNMNYTTGRNAAWSAKNIYDIAGNVFEWTMEAYYSDIRIIRGGHYYGNGSGTNASSRVGNRNPIYNDDYIGFRPTLYLI